MYTGILTSTCLPFTGKCRYFENLNSRYFDLCFENTENIAILIISQRVGSGNSARHIVTNISQFVAQ